MSEARSANPWQELPRKGSVRGPCRRYCIRCKIHALWLPINGWPQDAERIHVQPETGLSASKKCLYDSIRWRSPVVASDSASLVLRPGRERAAQIHGDGEISRGAGRL